MTSIDDQVSNLFDVRVMIKTRLPGNGVYYRVQNKIYDQVKNQVCYQVRDQIAHQVSSQVYDLVKNHVLNRLVKQFKEQP